MNYKRSNKKYKIKSKKRTRRRVYRGGKTGQISESVRKDVITIENPAHKPADTIADTSDDSSRVEDINEAVKKEKAGNMGINLGISDMYNETGKLVDETIGTTVRVIDESFGEAGTMGVALTEGVAVNTMEVMGDLVGVDVTNPAEIGKKLDNIKESISDPENQQKMTEIVGEAAKVAGIAVKASEPFIDPLIDVTAAKFEEVGSKLGTAAVKVGLNTLEEVPFYGVAVGLVRSVSTVSDAVMSSINASSQVVTTAADAINGAAKNFDVLLNEKNKVSGRTNDSVKKFENSNNVPIIDSMGRKHGGEKDIRMNSSLKKGGTHRYSKNKQINTKKVRFLL
jgi:hypothetical protein